MRSTLTVILLAASLFVAVPVSAAIPNAPAATPPLPGLSEGLDRSLWCATMASTVARTALEAGDHQTVARIAPVAAALARQVATHFVAVHFPKLEIDSYIDLYETEIVAVLAGTSPQRYAPAECRALVAQQIVA